MENGKNRKNKPHLCWHVRKVWNSFVKNEEFKVLRSFDHKEGYNFKNEKLNATRLSDVYDRIQ